MVKLIIQKHGQLWSDHGLLVVTTVRLKVFVVTMIRHGLLEMTMVNHGQVM